MSEFYSKAITDEALKDVSLDGYSGVRRELSDGKGNILESTDTRDLKCEQVKKILELRAEAFGAAVAQHPLVDQMARASGKLDELEAEQMDLDIAKIKDKYQAKKAVVMAAKDCDTVQQISFD